MMGEDVSPNRFQQAAEAGEPEENESAADAEAPAEEAEPKRITFRMKPDVARRVEAAQNRMGMQYQNETLNFLVTYACNDLNIEDPAEK